MATETMLVRLKPYDPRRKFVLRRYVYAGIHFLVTRGWERVPKAVADYLRDVRQKEFDPYSPPAFDVCTEAEAEGAREAGAGALGRCAARPSTPSRSPSRGALRRVVTTARPTGAGQRRRRGARARSDAPVGGAPVTSYASVADLRAEGVTEAAASDVSSRLRARGSLAHYRPADRLVLRAAERRRSTLGPEHTDHRAPLPADCAHARPRRRRVLDAGLRHPARAAARVDRGRSHPR